MTSAEVHPPLAAVDERLEGTDDIVAVDAEVEREVVAGAGGHARVRQPELGGDRGDDRLRAVPARHREPVRAALDRAADEHLEIVTRLQLDRLDPPLARLLGEREALRLPAAGARIEEQHRSARRRGARQIHVDGESGTRRRQRHQEPRHHQQIDQRRPTRNDQGHRTGEREASDSQPRHPRDPPPEHPVPGRRSRDHHAAQQNQATRELGDRHRDGERDRGRSHHQREDRQQSPSHEIGPGPGWYCSVARSVIADPPHTSAPTDSSTVLTRAETGITHTA